MNKDDRREFDELKRYLEKSFKDKYEPDNGWKTARAVFESETVGALGAINIQLKGLKVSTDKIPDLVVSINDIQAWRKKMNKILLWFVTCFTSVGLFVIYQLIKDAFK